MIRIRLANIPWLQKVVLNPGEQGADRVRCDVLAFKRKIFSYYPNLKTGASYNLYDGEELLRASALSIRRNVDFINVVYQKVSNFGEEREDLAPFLETLKREGVIDNYILYEPDLKLLAPENETRKRVLGLRTSRAQGCRYHLDLDCDEFYREDEFAAAKILVYASGADYSACSVQNYMNRPEYRVLEPPSVFVPFLLSTRRFLRSRFSEYFPCLIDGTRKLANRGRFLMFRPCQLMMHHMSQCRKDLGRKRRNSSLMQNAAGKTAVANAGAEAAAYMFRGSAMPGTIDVCGKKIIQKVPDEFNIRMELW